MLPLTELQVGARNSAFDHVAEGWVDAKCAVTWSCRENALLRTEIEPSYGGGDAMPDSKLDYWPKLCLIA